MLRPQVRLRDGQRRTYATTIHQRLIQIFFGSSCSCNPTWAPEGPLGEHEPLGGVGRRMLAADQVLVSRVLAVENAVATRAAPLL